MAYITAHFNTKGDVYQGMADEEIWLTTESGDRLIQDFGMFDVSG